MNSKTKKKRIIEDIEYPYKKTWDTEQNYVELTVSDVNSSIVNSIRRIIISGIETIAIKTEPHNESQIEIFQNDSPLHNQFLSHRLGMIPFNVSNVDEFDYNDYELILDEESDSDFPKHITSEYIKIRKISTDTILSEKDTRKLIPQDNISKEFHLISILKPKYYQRNVNVSGIDILGLDKTKLKIYLKCKLSKGSGSENGKYNPTSVCCYYNVVDEHKAKEGFKEFITSENKIIEDNNLTKISRELLERKFNTSERDRFYHMDKYGEPNKFRFKVESIGPIPPLLIFYRGIRNLKFKITQFKSNCINQNENIIEFTPSKNLNNGYDILVNEEDDTLGNIIQTFINDLFCNYTIEEKKIKYVGYVKVHPLKKQIILSIQTFTKTKVEDLVKEFIVPACTKILNILNNISNDLEDSGLLIKEMKKNVF